MAILGNFRFLHLKNKLKAKYASDANFKKFYDKFIHVIVFVNPLLNLPQIYNVWTGSTAGVSGISFLGFAFISLSWMIYGVIHNEKYIATMNAALLVAQLLIAIPVLLKA